MTAIKFSPTIHHAREDGPIGVLFLSDRLSLNNVYFVNRDSKPCNNIVISDEHTTYMQSLRAET